MFLETFEERLHSELKDSLETSLLTPSEEFMNKA